LPTRYHIEEIVRQDASGITFQALDSVTGRSVALRRFFPFGAEGGGLEHEEKAAYEIALERLSRICHPALLGVSAGGCDPEDGMPYIVTEWVEGVSLLSLLERAPLQPREAAQLIMQALEVSLLVSEILADEAVWIETSLESIVRADEDSGREFVFPISPMKWLGGEDFPRGLDEIITLAEQTLHWHGKLVSDTAGGGLGGWIKWLRGAAASASIREAMEMLAAATGGEPPMSTELIVAQSTQQIKLPDMGKPRHLLWWMAAAVVALVVGLTIWRTKSGPLATDVPEIQTASADPLATPSTTQRIKPAAARANELAERLSQQLAEKNALDDQRRQQLAKPGAIYQISDADFLVENVGKEVVLEGTLANTRFSGEGKGPTLYIEFSNPAPHTEPRGFIMRKDMNPDMQPEKLAPLIGKRIRIRGIVETETISPGGKPVTRPRLRIAGRGAIELVE
jgi:hypothetical protein